MKINYFLLLLPPASIVSAFTQPASGLIITPATLHPAPIININHRPAGTKLEKQNEFNSAANLFNRVDSVTVYSPH